MSMPRCRIIFPGIRTSVRSFLVREASDARTLVRAFFFLRRQVCVGGFNHPDFVWTSRSPCLYRSGASEPLAEERIGEFVFAFAEVDLAVVDETCEGSPDRTCRNVHTRGEVDGEHLRVWVVCKGPQNSRLRRRQAFHDRLVPAEFAAEDQVKGGVEVIGGNGGGRLIDEERLDARKFIYTLKNAA